MASAARSIYVGAQHRAVCVRKVLANSAHEAVRFERSEDSNSWLALLEFGFPNGLEKNACVHAPPGTMAGAPPPNGCVILEVKRERAQHKEGHYMHLSIEGMHPTSGVSCDLPSQRIGEYVREMVLEPSRARPLAEARTLVVDVTMNDGAFEVQCSSTLRVSPP